MFVKFSCSSGASVVNQWRALGFTGGGMKTSIGCFKWIMIGVAFELNLSLMKLLLGMDSGWE